jgi:hypothetical protein
MKKLIVVLFLFFTTFAYSSDQMIEIAVEITEINESDTRGLGIKWNDVIVNQFNACPHLALNTSCYEPFLIILPYLLGSYAPITLARAKYAKFSKKF